MNNSHINDLQFYNSYHTHPINKAIHFFCIPLIVFSTNELIKEFYIANDNITYPGLKKIIKFHVIWFVHLFYTFYYFYTYGIAEGYIMNLYFMFVRYLSYKLNIKKKTAFKLFSFSWIMQFIGHFIEGNRPALLDSLSQSFLGAPLYSLQYLFPHLLKQ